MVTHCLLRQGFTVVLVSSGFGETVDEFLNVPCSDLVDTEMPEGRAFCYALKRTEKFPQSRLSVRSGKLPLEKKRPG